MKRTKFQYIIFLLLVFILYSGAGKCVLAANIADAEEAVKVEMEDGEYAIDVSMTGGSGKAMINSPTVLVVQNGRAYAQIVWSSSNYDYMIVQEKKYLNESDEEMNSSFHIPVTAFDEPMTVIGDTLAMGTPHEVEYQLTFYSDSVGSKSDLPQEAAKKVVVIALIIIIGGGILNHIVKKRRGY